MKRLAIVLIALHIRRNLLFAYEHLVSDPKALFYVVRRICGSYCYHRCKGSSQILPETSFCIRLAISTSRRQARSRNDITRSMSWSLGSGISILRSLSAVFGSDLSESDFGSASSLLPLTVGSRAASSAFSFSLSACRRPIRSEEHTSELQSRFD